MTMKVFSGELVFLLFKPYLRQALKKFLNQLRIVCGNKVTVEAVVLLL